MKGGSRERKEGERKGREESEFELERWKEENRRGNVFVFTKAKFKKIESKKEKKKKYRSTRDRKKCFLTFLSIYFPFFSLWTFLLFLSCYAIGLALASLSKSSILVCSTCPCGII